MASQRWDKPISETATIFDTYGALPYIRDTYGILHVQGDEANLDDIVQYLRQKGAPI